MSHKGIQSNLGKSKSEGWQMATSRLDPADEAWYHGRISRIEAEDFLRSKGMVDGLFLVRDSLATTGEYALTLAHNGRAYHYRVARQGDGSLAIEDGKRFPGPVELVQYHTTKLDGLLTTLRSPCSRAYGVEPRGFRFVSAKEMKEATRQAALLLGYQVSNTVCNFEIYVCRIMKSHLCPVLYLTGGVRSSEFSST